MTPDQKRLSDELSRYFDTDQVRWKPQSVKNNRAMALAYIDARAVMERLDDVAGVGGWKTEYTVLDNDSVECRLSLFIDGQWVTKADVGSPSEQPDAGDRMKAAYSDALKRAAVQFGVGRYLYRLPRQWVEYDAQKRAFATTPPLPDWAIPATSRPCGRAYAAKLDGLIATVAERLDVRPERITDKKLRDFGLDPTKQTLADLWLRDAKDLLQQLNEQVQKLGAAPKPQPAGVA